MIPFTKTGNTAGKADFRETEFNLDVIGWKDLRGLYEAMTTRLLDRYPCEWTSI